MIGIAPNPDILCRSRNWHSVYNRPITNISGLSPISTVRTLKATVIYNIYIYEIYLKHIHLFDRNHNHAFKYHFVLLDSSGLLFFVVDSLSRHPTNSGTVILGVIPSRIGQHQTPLIWFQLFLQFHFIFVQLFLIRTAHALPYDNAPSVVCTLMEEEEETECIIFRFLVQNINLKGLVIFKFLVIIT